MGPGTSNWTKFKWPYEPLDHFTRSEPFPSNELKATYIDGRKKPKKRDTKDYYRALKNRWDRMD